MDKNDVKVSTGTSIRAVVEPLPLRLLVIGNFAGTQQGVADTPEHSAHQEIYPILRTVDDNNLDSFFASLNVDTCISINDFFTADGPNTCIRFKPHNIHDFTPAGLLESVPEFRALKLAQHKMNELVDGNIDEQQFLTTIDAYSHIKPLRMLCQDIRALAARDPDQFGARQSGNRYKCVGQAIEYIIDTEVSKFLHHPRVQEIEALWRGLKFFVDRSNFQASIQIDCLNTSYHEVLSSFEYFVLAQRQQDSNKIPYSAIVSTFQLENNDEQISSLQKLAENAEMLQTPLLVGLSHEFFGVEKDMPTRTPVDPIRLLEQPQYQQWNSLRQKTCAHWLVVLYNQFLLRNQYESDMRSAAGVTEHINKQSQRLWGNPALALASLMTRSFEISQWTNAIQGQEHGRIEDLPLFSQQTYGEPDRFQTLESTMTLEQAEDFATKGITTLSCTPDEDCAYIYYAPCVYDVSSTAHKGFAELSGSMNNLPYQLLFSRVAHQVQQNYEKLTQIKDPVILKSAVTTILQRLISSTGKGASLAVTVSNTDDDSGRHIISIHAKTGDAILSGSEVEFGLMV
jgi:type VI secretion system ImpC/EvpB family protein/type VI secretion system ImpB/VipA family protein